VKTEYTPTVSISVRARPMRSERTPPSTPPMAEAERVTVASAPVAPLPTPNVVPIAVSVSVSVRMMRSNASSE
jgi:hypothetical protein